MEIVGKTFTKEEKMSKIVIRYLRRIEMGKIVLFMGASASGKKSLYRLVKERNLIPYQEIIQYTTRPKESNEESEFSFTTFEEMEKMLKRDHILERRSYNTFDGMWYYFTCCDNFDLKKNNYIGINTLQGLDRYLKYFGEEDIISLLVQVDGETRIKRALERENRKIKPNYEELCRRYLADSKDFSLENIQKRKISAIIDNNGSLDDSYEQVKKVLEKHL